MCTLWTPGLKSNKPFGAIICTFFTLKITGVIICRFWTTKHRSYIPLGLSFTHGSPGLRPNRSLWPSFVHFRPLEVVRCTLLTQGLRPSRPLGPSFVHLRPQCSEHLDHWGPSVVHIKPSRPLGPSFVQFQPYDSDPIDHRDIKR